MRALAALFLAALVAVAAGASAAAPTRLEADPVEVRLAKRLIEEAIDDESAALAFLRDGPLSAARARLEDSQDSLDEIDELEEPALDDVARFAGKAWNQDDDALEEIADGDRNEAARHVRKALVFKQRALDEWEKLFGEQTPTRPDFTAMGSAENTGSGRTTFSFDLPGGIGRIITILISLDRPPFNRTGAAREQGPIKGSSGYTIGKNGPTGKGSCTTRAGVVTCKLKQAIPSGGFFLIELSPELPVGTKLLAKLKTADGKYGVARATVRQL